MKKSVLHYIKLINSFRNGFAKKVDQDKWLIHSTKHFKDNQSPLQIILVG